MSRCWSISFSLIVFLKVICSFLWLFLKSSLYPVVLLYEDGISRCWFIFVSPFLVFRMHSWKIQVFLLFCKLLAYYLFKYHFSTILSILSWSSLDECWGPSECSLCLCLIFNGDILSLSQYFILSEFLQIH